MRQFVGWISRRSRQAGGALRRRGRGLRTAGLLTASRGSRRRRPAWRRLLRCPRRHRVLHPEPRRALLRARGGAAGGADRHWHPRRGDQHPARPDRAGRRPARAGRLGDRGSRRFAKGPVNSVGLAKSKAPQPFEAGALCPAKVVAGHATTVIDFNRDAGCSAHLRSHNRFESQMPRRARRGAR